MVVQEYCNRVGFASGGGGGKGGDKMTDSFEAKQSLVKRCPVRLSNSQAVSLIQHVLMTLVLRLIMNGGFSFDSANSVPSSSGSHG